MSVITTQPPASAPANGAIAKTERLLSHDDSIETGNLLDTARYEQMVRLSTMMAYTAPKHLQGTARDPAVAWKQTCSNCFRIANQSIRWGFDPFAVMDETYVVHGKLGYQGKLVHGVVNKRAGLLTRLSQTYKNDTGKPDDLTIVMSGQFKDETEPRTVELSVKQGKTDNDMWTKDPKQKLIYSAAIRWARAHCPEIILGIVTEDDLERMRASGALAGNGDSFVQRSALNDSLSTEGDMPAGNGTATEGTGDMGSASGLDQSGEGAETASTEGTVSGATTESAFAAGGQLSPKGAELMSKIEQSAGDMAKLTTLLQETVATYKAKAECSDPEGQFLYQRLDAAIVAAKSKSRK